MTVAQLQNPDIVYLAGLKPLKIVEETGQPRRS
jgi:hypothetical protein